MPASACRSDVAVEAGEHWRWIAALAAENRSVHRQRPLEDERHRERHSAVLIEGMLSRVAKYRDGTRQVVSIHVPGDFVQLGTELCERNQIVALTHSVVALIPNRRLEQVTREHPDKLQGLWMLTAAEAAIARGWLFRLGRLDAIERIAHLLSEMNVRLAAVGLSDGTKFVLPLTQGNLAEICGLTSVHVNRVMRTLREMRLCTFRSSVVEISDRALLETVGQFDGGYLQRHYDRL